MFETLTDRLSGTLRNLTGRGRLTEDNIKDALREVRRALLEADVALPVITKFIDDIKDKAVGQEVMKSLRPGDELINIVNKELVLIMGEKNDELNLKATPPAVILLAGLQGSGKTTTTAKLAKYLQDEQKKSVMITSCDIYRPAAIKQLETLAAQIGADYHPSHKDEKPTSIALGAISAAKRKQTDVVIIDTAGRMHV
ncbi:MAG: signal recognition particle receptor subunit alpha, partial [Coxiellaceae bacterium]|nr:signal recognition particle receptor subunit alpha [Coxiellaceae bacterium]